MSEFNQSSPNEYPNDDIVDAEVVYDLSDFKVIGFNDDNSPIYGINGPILDDGGNYVMDEELDLPKMGLVPLTEEQEQIRKDLYEEYKASQGSPLNGLGAAAIGAQPPAPTSERISEADEAALIDAAASIEEEE